MGHGTLTVDTDGLDRASATARDACGDLHATGLRGLYAASSHALAHAAEDAVAYARGALALLSLDAAHLADLASLASERYAATDDGLAQLSAHEALP